MTEIRGTTPEDAPLICRLAEKTWWPTYSPILAAEQISYMLRTIYDEDLIAGQIKNGQQQYLILLHDHVPKGFTAFAPRSGEPNVFKLHKLYCLPETKGMGFGKKLLREVEKGVVASGATILDLNVNRYNPARSFYEKMGFSVIYEEDIPIGPYWMNDYVMRKSLTTDSPDARR